MHSILMLLLFCVVWCSRIAEIFAFAYEFSNVLRNDNDYIFLSFFSATKRNEKKLRTRNQNQLAVIKQNEVQEEEEEKNKESERERETYDHLTWNDMKLAQEYKLHTWRFTLCYRNVCIQNWEIRMYANPIVNANGNEQQQQKPNIEKRKAIKNEKIKQCKMEKKGIVLLFLSLQSSSHFLKYILKWKWWMVSWSVCVRMATKMHWIAITTCNFWWL